jgi:hypothetical protein
MISEVREPSADELAREELSEAEMRSVSGGDHSSHRMISNCMRAASDTQNYIVSNLKA